MSSVVLYDVKDNVATVTLNRPDQLNAMTQELVDEVVVKLEVAASDDDVRVVIFTGAGRAFCVGGDLEGMAEGNAGGVASDGPTQSLIHNMRRSMFSSQLLRDMHKPTIAAINGACAGAGLSWACAADLRFCAEKAVFNTAFVNAGVSGDFGGSWTLPRIVGFAKARELYFLGQKFDSVQAEAMGLVSRRFPNESFLDSVTEVATHLASLAP
jgi:2-(1,2-epoxy-1,2-dihydrophenyl)acetyl-CoA isomerase